jgi:hypothetical protein
MKKIGLILVVLVVLAVLSSCNMHKSCPAYSDNSDSTEQNV